MTSTIIIRSADWVLASSASLALELKARCFDGAKWSRRETPADPFEEVVT